MDISLISTATIPWFTGPSISSIERLNAIRNEGHKVTLYTPWVEPKNQRIIFSKKLNFNNKEEHLSYIQDYLKKNNKLIDNIKLYDSYYEDNSLYPLNSIDNMIEPCDVLVLEEAEHILWYQTFSSKPKKAKYIVGIIQSNYKERVKYLISPFNLKIQLYRLLLPYYNAYICGKNCDRIISVSRSIEYKGNIIIARVNGVRDIFLQQQNHQFIKDFYYLGAVTWEKNLKELIEYCGICKIPIDIYGSAINDNRSTMEKIIKYSSEHGDYLSFQGSTIEPHKTLASYKTYISCSVTEGYCAVHTEAIAMGKFVIIARHPSNEFFYGYDNVLLFDNPQEFAQCIEYTLNNEPTPLSKEELEKLSWKKATKILLSKFIPSNI